MKASTTTLESLADLAEVTTSGDLRRIIANSLLALARKEISATDVEAMAKGLDAINNSLTAEIKLAKASIELREKGANIGRVVELGNAVVTSARKEERVDRIQ